MNAASAALPVCDFCGAGRLGDTPALFACAGFDRTIPDLGVIHFESGWWGACTGCARHVRARAIRQLVDRQLDQRRRHGDPLASNPTLRPELSGLFLHVARHLTGHEQPWQLDTRPTSRRAA